ncbi:DUF2513 domain-containing protein [Pseudomonas serbica]|uniref:DUF2513 domain-containing protein n=1 Tax=Pseudomonas serbica TaxID=2965074 RepID=UPI00237BD6E6|nr:hypothetical protein [Pseudomonas serbica]
MKRDLNIIFRIIHWLQESDHMQPLLGLPGVEPDLFKYHAWLMSETGLIRLNDNELFQPHILTWEGHEFADSNYRAMREVALDAANAVKIAAIAAEQTESA